MPSLKNITDTINTRTYSVRSDEFNYDLRIGRQENAEGEIAGVGEIRSAWVYGVRPPMVGIVKTRTAVGRKYLGRVPGGGLVEVLERSSGSWVVKTGTMHDGTTFLVSGNNRKRTFREWYAAMAAGLDEVLVPIWEANSAAQQEARRAKREAHEQYLRRQHLRGVLERAEQGEMQRLVEMRERFVGQLFNAAANLNLGHRDTETGGVFKPSEWAALDSRTLSMVRQEIDAVSSALHEVQAYTVAIEKFEADLAEARKRFGEVE